MMPTATTEYPLSDLLYRSAALTDASGAVQEAYDTDAYGNTLLFDGPGPDGDWFTDDDAQADVSECRYVFTGREYDFETEVYFYRARYYRPPLGRFGARDLLTYSDGLNLYQYVRSNPAANTDPAGLACCLCAAFPDFCHITVEWHGIGFQGYTAGAWYYKDNLPGSQYQVNFQVFATVTLHGPKRIAPNFSLEACHLRQDAEGHASWRTPEGLDWTTPEDYSSRRSAQNKLYHGWWFEDGPGIAGNVPTAADGRVDYYWWQAHVFVEEAHGVETWWGFAGSAAWNSSTGINQKYGFARWRYQKLGVFVPIPRSH